MAKMNEVKPISLGPESKEETIESCPKGRERARICLLFAGLTFSLAKKKALLLQCQWCEAVSSGSKLFQLLFRKPYSLLDDTRNESQQGPISPLFEKRRKKRYAACLRL